MDSIIDLFVLIAVIYGVAKRAKKGVSKEKETPQPPKRQVKANQKNSLNNNETRSAFDSLSYEEWKQYEENISTKYYRAQKESLPPQEIKREEADTKQSENQIKNMIRGTQITDEINKSEIGNSKLSFDRNKIIEVLIMAEVLGKPKALRKKLSE